SFTLLNFSKEADNEYPCFIPSPGIFILCLNIKYLTILFSSLFNFGKLLYLSVIFVYSFSTAAGNIICSSLIFSKSLISSGFLLLYILISCRYSFLISVYSSYFFLILFILLPISLAVRFVCSS